MDQTEEGAEVSAVGGLCKVGNSGHSLRVSLQAICTDNIATERHFGLCELKLAGGECEAMFTGFLQNLSCDRNMLSEGRGVQQAVVDNFGKLRNIVRDLVKTLVEHVTGGD